VTAADEDSGSKRQIQKSYERTNQVIENKGQAIFEPTKLLKKLGAPTKYLKVRSLAASDSCEVPDRLRAAEAAFW
jgi:hypothetical protein